MTTNREIQPLANGIPNTATESNTFQGQILQMLSGLNNKMNSANVSNEGLNTIQDIDTSKKTSSAQVTEQKSTNENNSVALSDERCKELFGSTDLLDAIADIDAYRFRYKEGADKIDPNATSDKERIGVMAQDLASNPATKDVVEQDPSGYLTINLKDLTMETFAAVTELAKRVKELEAKCGSQ